MVRVHPDRRTVALGLLAGGLAAPGLARAQMHEPARVTRIDPNDVVPETVSDSVLAASTDIARRVTVPVTVNGRGPFPFIVDTGSTTSVVSEVLAAQLGLPMAGNLLVKAATGPVESGGVAVDSLAVGNRRLKNLHMPVLERRRLGGLGILGLDAVSSQKLVMDFKNSQMLLTASSRRGDDPNAITVRARSKYGQLLLVDCNVEGMPLYVILDTGSELTLGNLTMRAMLEHHRAAYEVEVSGVGGDPVTAPIGLLRTVDIGDVGVTDLAIAYADLYVFDQFGLHDKPAMLLGMNSLRHFARVSADFPAREVRFTLP
jgi:predicted aspartyl protease